jgi:hypothetical protein
MSTEILFNYNSNFSIIKRFNFKIFYNFVNLSKLEKYDNEKIILRTLIYVYNDSKKKIQTLVLLRPPLVIICALSFHTLMYLTIIT